MKFESLTNFYEQIERLEQDDCYENNSVADSINELLKDENYLVGEEVKILLGYEIEAFSFRISEGDVHGFISYTDDDGVVLRSYPDAKQMKEVALDYYHNRSQVTKNNYLSLRYLQILVSSGNPKFASLSRKRLIDVYLAVIEELITPKLESNKSYQVSSLMDGVFRLSKMAKYKTKEVSDICLELFLNRSASKVKYRFSELIIVNRRYYTNDTLMDVYDQLISLLSQPPYNDDCFAMESLFKSGIRLAKIIKYPTNEWYRKLAQTYEIEMVKRSKNDSSMMMAMHWCEKAIEQYQLASDKEKANDLHLEYSKFRKEFNLTTYQIDLDREEMTHWYEFLDRKAKYLIGRNDADSIFEYLSDGNDIFPDVQKLKEGAKALRGSFFSSISKLKADINKNFSKKVVSKDEHELDSVYSEFTNHLNYNVLPFLRRIFYFGYVRQKLSLNGLLRFLQAKSWIGCTLVTKDSGGNEIRYNWLSLIAPALLNFDRVLQAHYYDNRNEINVVLAIDSLVLKFEGLLREFARMLGLRTTVFAKGHMREMYIEELLALDKLRNYFNENDILLFRYLLVSKNGWNLRNSVAHAYLRFNQYTVNHMLLLIAALLRLGKYTVSTDGK